MIDKSWHKATIKDVGELYFVLFKHQGNQALASLVLINNSGKIDTKAIPKESVRVEKKKTIVDNSNKTMEIFQQTTDAAYQVFSEVWKTNEQGLALAEVTLRYTAVAEGGRVLVLSEGVLVEKVIEVGLRNWRYAEVLDGLEVGEAVVVARNSPDIKAGALAEERKP